MAQVTLSQAAETQTPTVTVEMVTAAIAHLNHEQLRDVWQFVQLLGEAERKAQPTREPNRQEVIQQLVAAGLVRSPGSWDTPGAKAWRDRPEEEKQQLIKEMQATHFPDSFASNLVSENRR